MVASVYDSSTNRHKAMATTAEGRGRGCCAVGFHHFKRYLIFYFRPEVKLFIFTTLSLDMSLTMAIVMVLTVPSRWCLAHWMQRFSWLRTAA